MHFHMKGLVLYLMVMSHRSQWKEGTSGLSSSWVFKNTVLLNGHYIAQKNLQGIMQVLIYDLSWRHSTDRHWWEIKILFMFNKHKNKKEGVLDLDKYPLESHPWLSHPSIIRFSTHGSSWSDSFWKSWIFGVKAGLSSLILRLRDMWTHSSELMSA